MTDQPSDVEKVARAAADEIGKFQLGYGMSCPLCQQDVDTCEHSNTDVRSGIIARHFRAALSALGQGEWAAALSQVDEEQRTYYRDSGSEDYHKGYNMALAAMRRRFAAFRRPAPGGG